MSVFLGLLGSVSYLSFLLRTRLASLTYGVIALFVLAFVAQPLPVFAKKKSKNDLAQSSEAGSKKRKKKRQSQASASDMALAAKPLGAQTVKANTAPVSDIELAGIYKAISQGQSASALGQTEALLIKAPNYKLLHLLRADLLLILSQRHTIKTAAGATHAFPAMVASHQVRIKELQQEAWLRLNSQANLVKATQSTVVPKQLLKLADNEPFALVVDSKLSRLYVYQNIPNAPPKLVTDFYVTQGLQGAFKLKEGDNRTPIGAYFISGPVMQKLPDLYGYGALNMDYPNVWDKRQGRTGYGIWLHGTPSETYARAPYASNGCVVLANPDMEMVFKLANTGAMPIVVVDKLEWVDSLVLEKTKKPVLEWLDQWRIAQEKGDLRALAKQYSTNFSSNDVDKNTLPTATSKITLSNVAVIEYPGETDLLVVRFDMASAQNASPTLVRKQLYLKKESGNWKIILDNTL